MMRRLLGFILFSLLLTHALPLYAQDFTVPDALPHRHAPLISTAFAEMKPAANQASNQPWIVTDPYGNPISTAGTTCQGFDKLVSVAATNKWSWRVVGNGSITCTAPVSIPTCFERKEFIDTGISINFSAQGSSNLVTMDSHENCDVQFFGAFTQNSADTGAVIDLAPTTNDQVGNTVYAANDILISSVAPGTGGIGVQMDPTSGGFIGNQFTIHDVNAGATGIKILNPGSGTIAFEQNRFFGIYNHGQTTRNVQIGTSSTNQANIRYNVWHSGRIDPNGATVAWDSWASNDTYIGLAIDNETSAATTGLKFESGANNNTVVGGVIQATTALSDGGTGNQYINVKGLSNVSYPARMRYCVTGVNFNSATTDNALPISFPTSRWVIGNIRITNASASISTATVGVFTATGGGGQTIAANQAITVTATAGDTNNNTMALALTNGNTMAYTDTTLQVRVGTAQGSAATADVCAEIIPLT